MSLFTIKTHTILLDDIAAIIFFRKLSIYFMRNVASVGSWRINRTVNRKSAIWLSPREILIMAICALENRQASIDARAQYKRPLVRSLKHSNFSTPPEADRTN